MQKSLDDPRPNAHFQDGTGLNAVFGYPQAARTVAATGNSNYQNFCRTNVSEFKSEMNVVDLVATLEAGEIDYRIRILRYIEAIEALWVRTQDAGDESIRSLPLELAQRFLEGLHLSHREYEQVILTAAQRLFDLGAYKVAAVLLSGATQLPKSPTIEYTLDLAEDLRDACLNQTFGRSRGERPVRGHSWRWKEVDVFFATSRAISKGGHQNPYLMFGGQTSDRLSFGKAIVSVPSNRLRGTLPRDTDREKTERREEICQSQYYVLRDIANVKSQADFIAEVESIASQKVLLIFVHGFRVSLASALLQTAQIQADLELSGAAVTLAWPSFTIIADYSKAARSIDDAMVKKFAPTLEKLVEQSSAESICLVGHSLGCRALLRMLKCSRLVGGKRRINHLVLASADVPIGEFNETVDSINSSVGRVTAYASRADRALAAALVEPTLLPRAGSCADQIAQYVDAVDTSNCLSYFSSIWRHSDYIETTIHDLYETLALDRPPIERSMLTSVSGDSPFWLASIL